MSLSEDSQSGILSHCFWTEILTNTTVSYSGHLIFSLTIGLLESRDRISFYCFVSVVCFVVVDVAASNLLHFIIVI